MYETYRMLGREHEVDLEREARSRSLARGLPRRGLLWPLMVAAVVLIAAVALASSAAASSSPVLIPFTKTWVAPGHYQGTTSSGADLDVVMSNSYVTGNAQHFTATFQVSGLPGGRSVTAVLTGIFDESTGRTRLNGTVTAGWLAGAQAGEEGQYVGNGTFEGTLTLIPATA